MRYLVEYEFKTDFGNYYWFPLYINAENATLAEISAKTAQTAIEQHYKLIRRTKVQPIVAGINAEYISEYVNDKLSGRLTILEFDVWRFKELPTNPELNFDQHIELIEFSDSFSGDSIATTVGRHRFPVRLYHGDPSIDFKEFLLVNVVDPSNIDDFYIVVEISDRNCNTIFGQAILEGIWKDASIKGYKVRVDAPHTPDGNRHVHIAHAKHTKSKGKQVSWSDDKTRHDKKSFDDNFNGLERAKEIARKELGLDDNAVLEWIQPKGNLLLENIQSEIENNDIFLLKLN